MNRTVIHVKLLILILNYNIFTVDNDSNQPCIISLRLFYLIYVEV